MLNSILLDTNIIITVLNKEPNLWKQLQKFADHFLLSTISVCELFSVSGISSAEERKIENLLQYVQVVPVSYKVAREAAVLARTRPSRSRRSDLLIAATALVKNIPLASFNEKDFRSIPGLTFLGEVKIVS